MQTLEGISRPPQLADVLQATLQPPNAPVRGTHRLADDAHPGPASGPSRKFADLVEGRALARAALDCVPQGCAPLGQAARERFAHRSTQTGRKAQNITGFVGQGDGLCLEVELPATKTSGASADTRQTLSAQQLVMSGLDAVALLDEGTEIAEDVACEYGDDGDGGCRYATIQDDVGQLEPGRRDQHAGTDRQGGGHRHTFDEAGVEAQRGEQNGQQIQGSMRETERCQYVCREDGHEQPRACHLPCGWRQASGRGKNSPRDELHQSGSPTSSSTARSFIASSWRR
ncbi:MAG: hypothetical protein JSS47_08295 [Proteobacteria bacterium]|nr:hypothetical protein [Pseudomonadota bacterium]